MCKNITLKRLRAYPFAEREGPQILDKIIQFIEGNPHCFEGTHPPQQGKESPSEVGHITGSAWLLNQDRTHVLLTHHRKLNLWLQLGGHSDGEANTLLTALREAKEESGIEEIKALSENIFDIDIHTFPERKGIPAHLHYDIRFAFISEHMNFKISEESKDLKWVPLAEISKPLFEDSVIRMAHKTKILLNSH